MKEQRSVIIFYVFFACHVLCAYKYYIQYECIFLANNKINVNDCLREDLYIVPGIGKKTARKIEIFRRKNGQIHSIDDLQHILVKRTLRKAIHYLCFE